MLVKFDYLKQSTKAYKTIMSSNNNNNYPLCWQEDADSANLPQTLYSVFVICDICSDCNKYHKRMTVFFWNQNNGVFGHISKRDERKEDIRRKILSLIQENSNPISTGHTDALKQEVFAFMDQRHAKYGAIRHMEAFFKAAFSNNDNRALYILNEKLEPTLYEEHVSEL
ncbi:MAG: hypothetical protein QW303_06185 [Nitrososphaerota archaeon]